MNAFSLLTPRQVRESLAARVRALRLARGWKQTTLAERSGVSHLQQLAPAAEIPQRQAESIGDQVAAAVAKWSAHAREAGVGTRTARTIEKALGECLARV